MVEYSQITTTSYALTAEGEGIAKNGSHEYRVWKVLSPKGGEPKSVPDLQVR
jgi:phenylalanyl-tRNA synthetase alpha chain